MIAAAGFVLQITASWVPGSAGLAYTVTVR